MPRHIWHRDLRRRLYEILEHGAIGSRTGLIVGRLIVVLIVTNLVTMALESVPALQAQYGPLFIAIELLSLVVFTIEYGLRVWVAAEHAPHRHSSERKARWEFVSSPLGVIDLLAVLPFWFAFVLPGDLRVLLGVTESPKCQGDHRAVLLFLVEPFDTCLQCMVRRSVCYLGLANPIRTLDHSGWRRPMDSPWYP